MPCVYSVSYFWVVPGADLEQCVFSITSNFICVKHNRVICLILTFVFLIYWLSSFYSWFYGSLPVWYCFIFLMGERSVCLLCFWQSLTYPRLASNSNSVKVKGGLNNWSFCFYLFKCWDCRHSLPHPVYVMLGLNLGLCVY